MVVAYKYLKKEYFDLFKDKGTIYLNTLRHLRLEEQEGVRDELEGRCFVTVIAKEEPTNLSDEQANILFPTTHFYDNKIGIQVTQHHTLRTRYEVRDAYVFSCSSTFNKQTMDRLGYNSWYKVDDIEELRLDIYEGLCRSEPMIGHAAAKVVYEDKELMLTNQNKNQLTEDVYDFVKVVFTKPKAFEWQDEFRMVFIPKNDKNLIPLTISSKAFHRYCHC